jgi:hypothetical protein
MASPKIGSTTPAKGFSEVLRQHVTSGVVDYAAFGEHPDFAAFVDHVATNKVDSQPLNEKLAFYINAYNALAIKGILDGRSPKNFFTRIGYFRGAKYSITGTQYSLHDFEHKVIRPLGEARIHFALVCAAKSCPPLRSEAYTAGKLNRQLDEQARIFLNNSAKNAFDLAERKARISKIFDWFEEDFSVGGTLQQYLSQFVDDPTIAQALAENQFAIEFMDYNWSLNGSK